MPSVAAHDDAFYDELARLATERLGWICNRTEPLDLDEQLVYEAGPVIAGDFEMMVILEQHGFFGVYAPGWQEKSKWKKE